MPARRAGGSAIEAMSKGKQTRVAIVQAALEQASRAGLEGLTIGAPLGENDGRLPNALLFWGTSRARQRF